MTTGGYLTFANFFSARLEYKRIYLDLLDFSKTQVCSIFIRNEVSLDSLF